MLVKPDAWALKLSTRAKRPDLQKSKLCVKRRSYPQTAMLILGRRALGMVRWLHTDTADTKEEAEIPIGSDARPKVLCMLAL